MALHLTPRDSGLITVVDASGRITLGDGSAMLRKTIRQLVEEAHTNILLNLADVDYIDSSGIGELVSAYTAVRSKGGELKLLHLTKKVHDLLQITKLFTVFEVFSSNSRTWFALVRACAQSSGLRTGFVRAYARVEVPGSMPARRAALAVSRWQASDPARR